MCQLTITVTRDDHVTVHIAHDDAEPAAAKAIGKALRTINERLNHVADQESVDALTARVTANNTALTGAVTSIQEELTRLSTANPTVDLTGLQGAVDALTPIVDQAVAEGQEFPPPTV